MHFKTVRDCWWGLCWSEPAAVAANIAEGPGEVVLKGQHHHQGRRFVGCFHFFLFYLYRGGSSSIIDLFLYSVGILCLSDLQHGFASAGLNNKECKIKKRNLTKINDSVGRLLMKLFFIKAIIHNFQINSQNLNQSWAFILLCNVVLSFFLRGWREAEWEAVPGRCRLLLQVHPRQEDERPS